MIQITQEQYNKLKEKGLTDEDINSIAQKKEVDLSGISGLKGFAVGFTKELLGTAVGTAKLAQTAGQKILAGLTPGISYKEVREKTGFESLKPEIPSGKFVEETLETKGKAEKIGALTAFGAEFFAPVSAATKIGGKILQETGKIIYKPFNEIHF